MQLCKLIISIVFALIFPPLGVCFARGFGSSFVINLFMFILCPPISLVHAFCVISILGPKSKRGAVSNAYPNQNQTPPTPTRQQHTHDGQGGQENQLPFPAKQQVNQKQAGVSSKSPTISDESPLPPYTQRADSVTLPAPKYDEE